MLNYVVLESIIHNSNANAMINRKILIKVYVHVLPQNYTFLQIILIAISTVLNSKLFFQVFLLFLSANLLMELAIFDLNLIPLKPTLDSKES